jgi:hypothetical protein
MSRKRKRQQLRSKPPEEAGDERLKQRLEAARDALTRIRRGQAPTADELAAAPRLDFWWVVVSEQHYLMLEGIVTGHPRLADGALIETSPLLWLAADRRAARTVSRFYRLGPQLEEIVSRRH